MRLKSSEIIVAGTTNLGYITGKGVSIIKSNTLILNFIGREDRIFKKFANLVGNFCIRDSLDCLLPMMVNSVFSGLNFSLTDLI